MTIFIKAGPVSGIIRFYNCHSIREFCLTRNDYLFMIQERPELDQISA
jgi:hypothetical protein